MDDSVKKALTNGEMPTISRETQSWRFILCCGNNMSTVYIAQVEVVDAALQMAQVNFMGEKDGR